MAGSDKSTKNKIVEHLRNIGCTKREAEIYLDVIVHGASTVQEIARRLDENRVTVHSAVEQLLGKGIFSETRKDRRRLLVAEEPGVLLQVLSRKEQEIVIAKTHAEQAAALLSQLKRETKSTPRLRLRPGVDGLKQMLEESLTAKSEVLIVTDIEKFAELLGRDHLENFYSRRAALGIKSRLIWPSCDFAYELSSSLGSYSMNVRLSRQPGGWQVGFFCWNDTVAIKSLAEGSLTCTLIENPEIAAFYRNILFESLWRDSEEFS